MWNQAAITSAGLEMLAQWTEGKTLKMESASAGSGSAQNLAALTGLTNEQQQAVIASFTRTGSRIMVVLNLTANTVEYTCTQFGIWARLDNGPLTLFAVYQDEDGVLVPSVEEGGEWLYTFNALMVFSGSGTLSVYIDSTNLVTVQTLQLAMAEKQDIIQTQGILKGQGEGAIAAAVGGVDYLRPQDMDEYAAAGAFRGTCHTAADAGAKIVTCPDAAELHDGDLLVCAFTYGNAAPSPTLKLGSTAAAAVVSRGSDSLSSSDWWAAGDYVLFQFDAARWVLLMVMGRYLPMAQKNAAGGVPSLDAVKKVPAQQLRAPIVQSSQAPEDKTQWWIQDQVLKFYDGQSGTWQPVLPVWG